MQRLNSVSVDNATGKTKELFTATEKAVGMVPNAVKVMANSPAVLESYLSFSQAMSGAEIGSQLQNLVKLSVSEANDCEYCTSIGCVVGHQDGLSADQLMAGRQGHSEDAKTEAALEFARVVLQNGGKVTDSDLAKVRDAGFGDGEIVEIVSSVVLGCLTNFINNVAETTLDIPAAEPVSKHEMGDDSCCSSGACSTSS